MKNLNPTSVTVTQASLNIVRDERTDPTVTKPQKPVVTPEEKAAIKAKADLRRRENDRVKCDARAKREYAFAVRRAEASLKAQAKQVAKAQRIKAAAAKLQVQVEKAEQRIAKAEATVYAIRYKRAKNRKGLPDTFTPSPMNSRLTLDLTGFERVAVSDALIAIYRSDKLEDVISGIAKQFLTDRLQVCLLHASGKPDHLYVRYFFSMAMNDFMRSIGGKFNAQIKGWHVILDTPDAKVSLERYISEVFAVVVDVSGGAVLRAVAAPSLGQKTIAMFAKIPFHVETNLTDIIAALDEYRNDNVRLETLVVHDGESFVHLPDACRAGAPFWTQSPFLLIRYAVASGRPRYAIYSTLARMIEGIAFGEDKRTSMFIARFRDSCDILKLQGFEVHLDRITPESEFERETFRGGNVNTQAIEAVVRCVFPDLPFTVLSSDYVSLVDSDRSGLSHQAKISAYADLDPKRETYLQRICGWFAREENGSTYGYPVIVTRQFWEACDCGTEDFVERIDVVLHELAHYLISTKDIDLHPVFGGAHGIGFSVMLDILVGKFWGYLKNRSICYKFGGYRTFLSEDIYRIVDSVIGRDLAQAKDDEAEAGTIKAKRLDEAICDFHTCIQLIVGLYRIGEPRTDTHFIDVEFDLKAVAERNYELSDRSVTDPGFLTPMEIGLFMSRKIVHDLSTSNYLNGRIGDSHQCISLFVSGLPALMPYPVSDCLWQIRCTGQLAAFDRQLLIDLFGEIISSESGLYSIRLTDVDAISCVRV